MQLSLAFALLVAWTAAILEGECFRQLDAMLDGALHADIVEIVEVAGDDPQGASWADSYSVGDKCYIQTTFDHGIGDVEVATPNGTMTIQELYDALQPGPGSEDRPLYNDIQCGNGPPNDAADEVDCPGLVEYGPEGCGQIGPMWDLSELASTYNTSGYSSYPKDPSVFVLGQYFDYDTFVILVSIIGGCAIVIDIALVKYEDYLKCKGDEFQSTLYDKIVGELMTLGAVSFALYLLQPVVPKGDTFLVFEFTHFVIFFIAIFMVLQLVILGASTYPIKRRWDIAAYQSKEEILECYRSMIVNTRRWTIPVCGLGRVSLDVLHWGSSWKTIDAIQYHLARSIFLRQHGHTAAFDFARYATMVADRQILSMAKISIPSWMVLLACRWIVYGVQVGLSRDDHTVSLRTWIVFGVVLCLLEVLLLVLCMLGVRRVWVKLGADPRDPFKGMDAVLEKIWVAPITQMQHEASMKMMPASGEGSASDAPEDVDAVADTSSTDSPAAGAAAAAPSAAVHGSESSGRVEAREGTVGAAIEREKVEIEETDIPTITMRDAFIVRSGKGYKMAVEILMLLNSYYLAVYAMYFVSHYAKSSEWVLIIVLPLPIVAGVLIAYRRVVPLIALLSTIVMMKPTDVADVIQGAEELNRIRRKLVMRVADVLQQEYQACAKKGETCPEGHTSAAFLLKRWDEDNNGNLSYDELQKGLGDVGLFLSFKQRRELLRLADPDRNGSVDIQELSELLYDVEVEIAAAAPAGLDVEDEEASAAAAGGRTVRGRVRSAASAGNVGVNERVNRGVNERVERLLWKRASEKWS